MKPDKMKQLTIKQFQAIHAVSLKTFADETDRTVELVAAYAGVTTDQSETMKRDLFSKYAREVGLILQKLPAPIHATSVWIGAVKYRIVISPQSSTVAHQRVLQYCQSEESGGIVANMHLALSALSEHGKLFGLFKIKETHQKRAEKFRDRMPFSRAYGYLLFFCDLLPNLSKVISLEVKRKTKAQMKRMHWKNQSNAKQQ